MIRTNGFVQLRRGLVEHVADGSMTIYEAWIFVAILVNADPKTGVWIGSAASLGRMFPINTRYCQRALGRLEAKQYIKRFPSPGSNGSFPIAIHNFECTDGSLLGKRLNAVDSVDCNSLIYISVAAMSEVGTEVGTQVGTEVGTPLYRNGEKKQEKRDKNTAARKTAPPQTSGTQDASLGDKDRSPKTAKAKEERHTDFKEILGEYWASKNTHEMTWDGSEGKALSQLIAANPKLGREQFRALLRTRFRSDVNHTERPRAWLASAMNYANGPLDRFGKPKEMANGKGGIDSTGAVGRVKRTGGNWDKAIDKRLANSPGDASAADDGRVPSPGIPGGDDGDVLAGIRGSGD